MVFDILITLATLVFALLLQSSVLWIKVTWEPYQVQKHLTTSRKFKILKVAGIILFPTIMWRDATYFSDKLGWSFWLIFLSLVCIPIGLFFYSLFYKKKI